MFAREPDTTTLVHQPTPTTYLLIALAALISVCRCMRAGAGWSMLSKVSVQGVWKVVLMLWVARATPHTPLTLTYVNLKAGISMEVCVCWCVARAPARTNTVLPP